MCYDNAMIRVRKAFTLIELLVVIAIIGLLATAAVVNFANARKQARDTSRIGDLKAAAKALSQAASNADAFVGCTADGSLLSACVLGANLYLDFTTLVDPSTPGADCVENAALIAAPCRYTIWKNPPGVAPERDRHRVTFYLENGAGSLGAGGHEMTQDGNFQ